MVIVLTHVTNGNTTNCCSSGLMLGECQRWQRASVPDSGFVWFRWNSRHRAHAGLILRRDFEICDESRLFAGAAFSCTWLSVSVCRGCGSEDLQRQRFIGLLTIYAALRFVSLAIRMLLTTFFTAFRKRKLGQGRLWSMVAIFYRQWSSSTARKCGWKRDLQFSMISGLHNTTDKVAQSSTTLKAKTSILNSRCFRNWTRHGERRHIVAT